MKLNKDNLIGVIIGFIVLVIFAVCLSSGCTKRITPVPEIRYVHRQLILYFFYD